MHALIIEDHDLVAWMIEEELRELGYTSFDTAPSEDSAVEAAGQRKPDLITCDGTLSKGNGVSAVRKIRSKIAGPVVFITGDPIEARAAAPDHLILEKPFNSSELIRAVRAATAGAGSW
jgi:two-component system, response regulator PdtaR